MKQKKPKIGDQTSRGYYRKTDNPNIGRPRKRSEKNMENLGKKLLEYAKQEDAITLGGFCQVVDTDLFEINEIEIRSESFRQFKKQAMALIGQRREELALRGKLDAGIVKKTMPLFDPNVKAWELEQKGLCQQSAQDALRLVVRGLREETKASQTSTTE